MARYDAIVLGVGGIGSAALFHLAQRGARVIGVDRFPIAHDRGSSHGQTRIMRQAYFEHPDYVPLLRRAYESWADLEARHEQRLFHPVGLLQVGPRDGEVIGGVLDSARRHKLTVEQMSVVEVEQRWPGFRISDRTLHTVFEQSAGYLEVENGVRAHVEQAQRLGAEVATGEAVREWRASRSEVSVTTETRTITARKLVIAAGAWAPELLAGLGVSLQVLRKPVFWYRPDADEYSASKECPCFLFETPRGEFYGFPQLEPYGVKIAEHTGGETVKDPLTVSRELVEGDRARIEQFAATYLPSLGRALTRHAVCLYTMSPDKHFVVDHHPALENVWFVAGLSGHGFKFAPVLGEALADLALNGTTTLPIDFLRLRRFRSSANH